VQRTGLVLISPGGTEMLWPWNPLHSDVGEPPWKLADRFMGAMKRVWGLTDTKTPVILDTLEMTTLALARAGYTPLEILPFLLDQGFRQYIAHRANDEAVHAWVTRLDTLDETRRDEYVRSTRLRMGRLDRNPHLQHLLGLGVSDPAYHAAYWQDTRSGAAEPQDMTSVINGGIQLFVALPDTEVGEYQAFFAALVQDYVLAVVMARMPDCPEAYPETVLLADEFPVYISEAAATVLARTRAFGLTGYFFCQGLDQVRDEYVRRELKRNTAIKILGPTEDSSESRDAADMLFMYDEHELVPTAQQWRSMVQNLPARHFIAKLRGHPAMPIRTRDYAEPWDEQTAMTVATSRMVCPLVSIEQADRELDWRRSVWIRSGAYGRTTITLSRSTPEPLPFDRFAEKVPGGQHPGRA
jgi:hypothetical protein